MKTLVRIAVALIASVIPLSAMAETKAPAERHDHHVAEAFPMKAGVFKKLVERKLEGMKERFEQRVAKRSLTPEQKSEVVKSMESAVKELHTAVDRVGADGVVTKDEAKQVKDLSDQLRAKVREQLRGKHAAAHAKGQKPKAKALSKKARAKNI